MRKFTMVLALVAIVFTGCEDEKKVFTEQYDQLLTESDSLHDAHIKYQDVNEKMMQEHQTIVQEIQNVEVRDSTVFEDLAGHEVILKKHEAMLKGHEEMLEGHQELRDNFGNLSIDEMKAQIAEMDEVHSKIKEEHSVMGQEHDRLMQEHKNIRTKFEDVKIDEGTEEIQQ